MGTWGQILMGIFAVFVLLWFGPRVRESMRNTRKGSGQEWMGALIPIALVVLFVVFLISTI